MLVYHFIGVCLVQPDSLLLSLLYKPFSFTPCSLLDLEEFYLWAYPCACFIDCLLFCSTLNCVVT